MAASRINSVKPSFTLLLSHYLYCIYILQLIFIFIPAMLPSVSSNMPPVPGKYKTVISVQENATIGTIIGNLSASDPDLQPLTFKIDTDETALLVNLSAPRDDQNQSNIKIVDIILNSILDRDYAPSLRMLYFSVSDGAISIPIWIKLFIYDVNDVPPKFVNLPYEVTVKENTLVGTVIFSGVSTEDPDNSKNAYFTMESNAQAADEVYRTTFAINANNGNITLKRSLDYETHSYYQFKIMAEDDGGLKADPASFVVYVLDVQDSPPNFVNLPYSVHINEDIEVTMSIIKVEAVDGDKGIPNPITYTFQSGDYSNFQLDPSTGVITVKNSLDRDSVSMRNTGGVYAMIVKAAEVVPPGQENYGNTTATTLVTITVQDVNDNQPTFSRPSYIATIPENMQRGVPVAFQGNVMFVSDIDQGTNSHFIITFEKNGQPYYDFSPLPQEIYSESSVLIRVNNSEELDYEKNKNVVFQVVARELDTVERRSSTADVTINIEDMNDNAPVFDKSDFALEVKENTAVGTSVAQYNATDLDSGNYGIIKYYIRGGNGKFSIDEGTGIVRVAALIDREENDHFYLTVEAKDGGGLRTPAEVVVTVLDENDNQPIFRRNDYEGIVREQATSFLRPLKVEAFDNDESKTNYSKVSYVISATPPGLETNFTINSSTGEITISSPLDYEKLDPALNGSVTLTVEAFDAGVPQMSSYVFVNITVEDINDWAPVFVKSEYSTSIKENSLEGTSVAKVSAVDHDATNPNNYLIYRIESGALDKFRIKFDTGEVEIDKGAELDRESRDEYVLTISAIDRGTPPRSGYCTLKIKLLDVNDEMPVFSPGTRSVDVLENVTINFSVITFLATDPDLNPKLEYKFGEITAFIGEKVEKPVDVTDKGIEKYFGINSSSGLVYVQNKLDRETASKVVLEIIVIDKMAEIGDQTASGTLTVNILDSNDNAPVFLPSAVYNVNASETESVQSILLQVSAIDLDEAQTISFSIGSSTVNAFAISNDGTVRLITMLDRETHERVQFEVIATDNGSPPLSSTATVSVLVLDANDNPPIFSNYSLTFDVYENVSVNYLVSTFFATDKDIGDFATIFYQLSGPDNDGSFAIGEGSGKLTVARVLDRETKAVYRLEIVASDSKNSPNDRKSVRSDLITINIKDVDDNPANFTRVNPETPEVPESQSVLQTVAIVTAEDADDKNTDNALVLYYLTADTNATQKSDGSPLFKINETSGVITPALSLKGYYGIYYITVMATNKLQTFKPTKQIIIKILDVNDDSPKFVKPNVDNAVAYVLENSEKGVSVFQLEAVDSDIGPNGEIQYSIVELPNNNRDGSRTFVVDPVTGLITTNGADINAERQDRYELKVQARDKGFPNPYSTSLLMIVVVIDKNDHKPEFEGYTVPFSISMEEGRPGCTNVSLAIDRDKNTTYTTICYYLVGASLMDTFMLNTVTGMLCLNRSLDREKTPYADIVIQALEDCYRTNITTERINNLEPGKNPPMYKPSNTDKLWLKIQIEDINDNPPRFSSKDLALGVTRVTQYGKFILDLREDVEDADSAKWGVDYFVATSNFTAYPEALKNELESLGSLEPFRLFSNGSVKTNMFFKPQMSGFFIVDLKVFDKGGLSDTAKLRISLINDDQRLIIVFRRSIDKVAPYKDEIASYIGSKVGCRIVVDSIQTHETVSGQADLAKTDMFIHGENIDTNEVIPANKLLSMIDQKSALLMEFLNEYNIVQIVPTQNDNSANEFQEKLKMALILVSVILGTICIILAVVLYYTYNRYKRKLKAAKAMAYVNSGVEPDDRNLYKSDMTGTTLNSYEK